VLAQGAVQSLEALADWLQRGPPLARVDHVERCAAPVVAHAGFGVA
jgi:acylphosphatase